MRLKLRTELLDDDTLRAEFHEDLDDLDVMVKAALQSVKDTDIHENLTPVRLDTLLARLAQRPIHPDASIECTAEAGERAGQTAWRWSAHSATCWTTRCSMANGCKCA